MNGGKKGMIEIKKSDSENMGITKKNGHLIVVSLQINCSSTKHIYIQRKDFNIMFFELVDFVLNLQTERKNHYMCHKHNKGRISSI